MVRDSEVNCPYGVNYAPYLSMSSGYPYSYCAFGVFWDWNDCTYSMENLADIFEPRVTYL